MTEEKDYGSTGPSFNDLIRKYQAISENGEIAKEAVQEIPEPELKSDKDFEKELGEIIESVEQPVQDMPEEFTFDESLISEDEDDSEPEMTFKKEEPKFAYDLNMFGASQTSFNIDDIDDSWLDSSLDESIFYDPSKPVASVPAETAEEFVPEAEEIPEEVIEEAVEEIIEEATQEPVEEAVEEAAEGIQPEPVALPEEEPEEADEEAVEEAEPLVEEIHEEPVFVPVEEPSDPQPAMVGGYIAPSDADSFTFDPDSGMDFDEDDSEPKLPEMPADLPVFPEYPTQSEIEFVSIPLSISSSASKSTISFKAKSASSNS